MQHVLEELAIADPACELRIARAQLAAEFPSIFVRIDDSVPPHVRTSEWARPDFDTWRFDCAVDDLAQECFTLRIDRHEVALEVMNRCQRHVDRRNRHSHDAQFAHVLRHHRALHDLDKPLVRADYNHALDVWQWLLRLDPDASRALQIAALFHDIERLASEADARVEHLAPDYQRFKDAHARTGAEMTDEVLADAGVSESVRDDVAEWIASHEHTPGSLSDADALSFFSLNSSGYANYFGTAQTHRKVAYTWNRMSANARARIETVRLRPDVRAIVDEVARAWN